MLMRFSEWQIGRGRWLNAQKYEQAFWERLGADIAAGAEKQLDWYNWRARRLEEKLAGMPQVRTDNGKVLEIGCGPIGIINFLTSRERVAVDPLEHFYRRTPSLAARRDLSHRHRRAASGQDGLVFARDHRHRHRPHARARKNPG